MGRVPEDAGDGGEESRMRAQEVGCGVNQSLASVHQSIARRILSYLDNSEALKESTKDLKAQVRFSKRTKRQHRGKREVKKHKMFLVFSRQGAQDISVASFFFTCTVAVVIHSCVIQNKKERSLSPVRRDGTSI